MQVAAINRCRAKLRSCRIELFQAMSAAESANVSAGSSEIVAIPPWRNPFAKRINPAFGGGVEIFLLDRCANQLGNGNALAAGRSLKILPGPIVQM